MGNQQPSSSTEEKAQRLPKINGDYKPLKWVGYTQVSGSGGMLNRFKI